MPSPQAKLGNRRVTGKEQFYTPVETATEIVREVLRVIPQARHSKWLEPSAGTGAFIQALQSFDIQDVVALDIEPHHSRIKRQDFLTWKPTGANFIAVGNPPFGRNNSLSIPFFNKCAQISSAIAFIVPRSWRKWSVTNRLSMNFKCIQDKDLDINYVNVHGEDVYAKNNLRTCLQIWQRVDEPRLPVRVIDHGFVQKVAPQDADIAIKVFGYGCGTVLQDFPKVPNTTLMFLKIHDKRALKILKQSDFAKFFNNVAYTQALAFTEINDTLNKALLKNR